MIKSSSLAPIILLDIDGSSPFSINITVGVPVILYRFSILVFSSSLNLVRLICLAVKLYFFNTFLKIGLNSSQL